MNKPIHYATHRLKKYRTERDWTQDQMAQFLRLSGIEITRSWLARLEAGTGAITATHALEISRITKIPVDDLVMRKD